MFAICVTSLLGIAPTERLFKRLLTTRISTFEKTYGFFSCFLSIFPRSFLGSDSTNSTRRGYL